MFSHLGVCVKLEPSEMLIKTSGFLVFLCEKGGALKTQAYRPFGDEFSMAVGHRSPCDCPEGLTLKQALFTGNATGLFDHTPLLIRTV